jgi:plastocyanin
MSTALPLVNAQPSVIVTIPNGAGTSSASAPGYAPDNITVVIGTNNTVTWVNGDAAYHSVYSSTVPPGASAFHSPNLGFRDNFTETLTVAGTYYYYCSLHSWMTGTVTVKAATAPTPEFPAAYLAAVLFAVIAAATVVAPRLRPRLPSPA